MVTAGAGYRCVTAGDGEFAAHPGRLSVRGVNYLVCLSFRAPDDAATTLGIPDDADDTVSAGRLVHARRRALGELLFV